MTRRTPRQGRPTALTPEVQKRIVDMLRAGAPAAHAAVAAGIHRASYFLWMARGQDAADARQDGQPVPPRERRYVDFYDAAERARAEARVRAVANIQKVAQGGFVVRETVRRYRNADGQLVTETDKVYAPPDWRAAGWYLERADREHWSKTNEVQLTGRDGGPIEVGVADYEGLAGRLRLNLTRIAGELPGGLGGGGEVIEGEVDRAS